MRAADADCCVEYSLWLFSRFVLRDCLAKYPGGQVSASITNVPVFDQVHLLKLGSLLAATAGILRRSSGLFLIDQGDVFAFLSASSAGCAQPPSTCAALIALHEHQPLLAGGPAVAPQRSGGHRHPLARSTTESIRVIKPACGAPSSAPAWDPNARRRRNQASGQPESRADPSYSNPSISRATSHCGRRRDQRRHCNARRSATRPEHWR